MARLQILELPEGSGDDRPPFVLVFDQAPADLAGFDALRLDLGEHEDLLERIGARAVLVFEETIDIPANDTSAYLEAAVASSEPGSPDFTSPIAGRVEVRRPCPYCGDRQMIPRTQFAEHVARLHPDQPAPDA